MSETLVIVGHQGQRCRSHDNDPQHRLHCEGFSDIQSNTVNNFKPLQMTIDVCGREIYVTKLLRMKVPGR